MIFFKRLVVKIISLFLSLSKMKYYFIGSHIFKKAGMFFYTPTALCRWRVNSIYTKEPGTINWINQFPAGSVFWDIGANVGIYTIYASKKRNITVYAFEPSPFNYYVLSKNIFLNKLSSKISAFCLAFTNMNTIDKFNMSSVVEGAAHGSFSTMTNEFGQSFSPEDSCAMIGFSIDEFLKKYNVPCPNFLKIDVDGLESAIISGAKNLLENQNLKSILIELTTDLSNKDKKVFDSIIANGFQLKQTDHPDGEYRITNYIFERSS